MKAWILFSILLILTFLSAAKSHGRQHRLEREFQGYWQVSFTSQNHPWVERFWLQQRILYWSLASLTAGFLIFKLIRRRSWNLYGVIIVSVVSSMIVAFLLTGLLSAARLAFNLSESASMMSPDWRTDAIWGSVGFWSLTALSVTVLILSAQKCFRLSLHR